MKWMKGLGGILLSLLLRVLLDPLWTILAVLLLVMHWRLGISIWWFVGLVVLWNGKILLSGWLLSWAAKCGAEKPPVRENKNPYSVKRKDDVPIEKVE